MNMPAVIAVAHLPTLIDRAARALTAAMSSAEVLEARDMASAAYDEAKRAARLSKAKNAHDDVIGAVYRAQADALEIEAQAKRRLADEYDLAQERGEVASGRPKSIPDGNSSPATVAEMGLTSKAIHEARQIRNAEVADPGIVRRTLDERLSRGEEPSKAALRQAVVHAAQHGYGRAVTPARNPLYKPNASYDRVAAVAGLCRSLVEKTEGLSLADLMSGCADGGMRQRTLATLHDAAARLNDILESDDAAEA